MGPRGSGLPARALLGGNLVLFVALGLFLRSGTPHGATGEFRHYLGPSLSPDRFLTDYGVQWRKIMFGNRSAEGELAVALLLTVTRTCHLERLNALAYLNAAICAHRRRQAAASLLSKRVTPELLL